jgi:hypothetical protein
MPIITGEITWHGAIVCVLVGVGENRRKLLEKVGFPIPQPVQLRAEIDTGSAVTGTMHDVFRQLGLEPFKRIRVRTPSTTPENPALCDQYDVSISFISGTTKYTIPSVHAIASDDFQPSDEGQGIIGRDVLNSCHFQYFGPQRVFQLGF